MRNPRMINLRDVIERLVDQMPVRLRLATVVSLEIKRLKWRARKVSEGGWGRRAIRFPFIYRDLHRVEHRGEPSFDRQVKQPEVARFVATEPVADHIHMKGIASEYDHVRHIISRQSFVARH